MPPAVWLRSLVSTDGGYAYDAATLDNAGNWSFTWNASAFIDHAGFPVRIKAVDSAGNETVQASTFIVDNLGPSFIQLVTATPGQGTHIDAPTTVNLTWIQPTDGSGIVDIWVAVDQITDTIPSGDQTVNGNSYAGLDHRGGGLVRPPCCGGRRRQPLCRPFWPLVCGNG